MRSLLVPGSYVSGAAALDSTPASAGAGGVAGVFSVCAQRGNAKDKLNASAANLFLVRLG